MPKNNSHRKLYTPNYFAWFMCPQRSALNQKRYDKRQAKRKVRRLGKEEASYAEE